MTLRPLVPVLCLIALSVSACGEQRADSLAREEGRTPPAVTAKGTYDLATVERVLEAGGLDLQRDGGDSSLEEGLDPEPRTSQVYTAQDNSQLDLLVFATPDDAERATPELADKGLIKDGGASSRAGNIVLAISGGPRDRDAYKAAFAVFRTLGSQS